MYSITTNRTAMGGGRYLFAKEVWSNGTRG